MLKTIKTFDNFNHKRYSDPWVARVRADGRFDFSKRIGGYTGGYHTGEAGDLYIDNPEDGAVYVYGQKDYRRKDSSICFALYCDGEFKDIAKTDLVKVLNGDVEA